MTLVLHLAEGLIVGIFEHHTGEINRAQLEDMLEKLAQGTLTNEEIFNTSGHGALILDSPAKNGNGFPFLAVTGPGGRCCAAPHYTPMRRHRMVI